MFQTGENFWGVTELGPDNSGSATGAGRMTFVGLGRKLVFIRPSLFVDSALHYLASLKDSYDQLFYHGSWHLCELV